MEVGGLERLIDQYSIDETQVAYENNRLSMGEPLPINPFDNDEAHLSAHKDFQKSGKYRQLDPQIQQMIQQHVDMHQQRVDQMQQMQMEQQAMQQAMMAQASQPPQPPQPQQK
jgi:hypothetical protein